MRLLGSYTTRRVTGKNNDTATPVGFREVGNCGTNCIAQDVCGRSEAEESSPRKMQRNNGLVLLNVQCKVSCSEWVRGSRICLALRTLRGYCSSFVRWSNRWSEANFMMRLHPFHPARFGGCGKRCASSPASLSNRARSIDCQDMHVLQVLVQRASSYGSYVSNYRLNCDHVGSSQQSNQKPNLPQRNPCTLNGSVSIRLLYAGDMLVVMVKPYAKNV